MFKLALFQFLFSTIYELVHACAVPHKWLNLACHLVFEEGVVIWHPWLMMGGWSINVIQTYPPSSGQQLQQPKLCPLFERK